MPAKRQPTPGDMVRTLAVIFVPLLIITVFFTRNLADHPVTVVDYAPILATARKDAPFPVLAPVGLPSTWRCVKAEWVPQGRPYLNGEPSVRNLWQLGFLTPDDVYLAVEQGDAVPQQFIDDTTRKGLPDGSSQLGGQSWERRVSPDQRTRALVQSSLKVTTIVVGDTSYEGLEAFASTLRSS